ncbi:leukocyte elastase inhibitor-like isoform X3 [Cygnus atratus]|uniref:leukocyte elastase inhibitor-like isoform X3 n=1 Tax=Cygnus atratus TaxID=8868 RepID=UPI0015D56FEA|nr:leukocyte elastase inhibitor-like isoform X3 [Cygnus atratus]
MCIFGGAWSTGLNLRAASAQCSHCLQAEKLLDHHWERCTSLGRLGLKKKSMLYLQFHHLPQEDQCFLETAVPEAHKPFSEREKCPSECCTDNITMGSLCAANAKFCLDFFKELSKMKKNENIFFSPLSLSAAFGMVLLGARGNTLKQIEKVFHFGEVLTDATQRTRYPSEKQYLDSTKKFYRAELEAVDFKYTKEEAREKINFWVENETKGKIKDLFAAGSIDPSTVLVLVNAIYFKGKWAVEFKKEDTKETYFRLNKNERKTVQMMFREGYFKLAIIEEPKIKVIELPYFNNELSMLILLPEVVYEDFTGLEQLENTLTYEKIAEWTSLDKMQQLTVKVYLPQFKMDESYVLNKTLQEMGVMNVFDWGKADLSGISRKDGLVMSKAIHKSSVEVNEDGTEAVAATQVVAMPLSRSISYEFKADHPFLFFIRHNPTNTILFFGRYSSP